MATDQVIQSPEFAGPKKLQTLAGKAFDVLRLRGMFMSDYAVIRVPVEALTSLLAETEGAKPADVAKAIAGNPAVFATETVGDIDYVMTTRTGKAPVSNEAPSTHSFAARFMTPEPKPERPVRRAPERVRVDPNWATYSVPDFGDDDDEEELYLDAPEDKDIVVVVEAVEDVVNSADAEVATSGETGIDEAATVESISEVEDSPALAPIPEVETAPELEPTPEVEAAPVPGSTAEVETDPAPEPVADVETAPAPEVEPAPALAVSDFSGSDDAHVASAIESKLVDDPRVAWFAGQWMAEDRVARLGRNDIRRIKDYITEQEQPLTDGTLAQDILNVRSNSAEFEAIQFAVNYRLSREHREFDFVGTNNQRFWSTSSLPQIGTTRRKPNEIGTDYRYLVDEVPAGAEHRSIATVTHPLSFYEFTLGLLPYDLEMQKLMPTQVLPEQRSAVLTFEIPQLYTTYLVELRYPTPNRGGFLLGLDDFYAESLVPGAVISISATDNDGHYKVEFLPGSDQNARLLDLDDRRSPRYHFRPMSFACVVDPAWLVSEDRFPKLGGEKPLDDKVRRRPDSVLEATFERIGIEDGASLI